MSSTFHVYSYIIHFVGGAAEADTERWCDIYHAFGFFCMVDVSGERANDIQARTCGALAMSRVTPFNNKI